MCLGATSRRRVLRTIGARLTVWGAVVTLTVCACLCILLYTGLFYALRSEIDTFLEGEIPEFMLTVNSHANDDAGLEQAIRAELGSRARHDLAFRLLDENGQTIVTSEQDDPLAGLWVQPPNWNNAEPYFHFDTVRPTDRPFPFRTCSLLVVLSDGRTCTAQASYLLDRMTTSLALFRRACVVGLAVAAILAVAAGWVLSRRSLRPVRVLTETAKRINADTLDKRVPLAGTDDELDQLAATINGMLDRLEQYVDQIQQFTADASHELRSPLAALRGNAEVALTRHRSAEELRKVLEDSIEHYDRLTKTTEDLLLLARADAGRLHVRKERILLEEAAKDAVDLYAPMAQERGIDLTFEGGDTTWVKADGSLIRQLICNLVDNGVKYVGSGKTVRVSTSRENATARVTVTDDGPGIAPEHLKRIFDRFYRADPARSHGTQGGAGLGLSICCTIAEAHHGRVDIDSRLGQGTTVTLILPETDKKL